MTLAFSQAEDGVLPPLGHPTVLIIDGDGQSRDGLAATLSVEGFDVVTATDGAEGLSLVAAVDPALDPARHGSRRSPGPVRLPPDL